MSRSFAPAVTFKSLATRLTRPLPAFVADVVLVLVFAVIGRASHEEGNPVVGALSTAWPFLLGTAVGWLVVRVLRRSWPLQLGPGITVWFATLVFGMLLRHLTGQGTAVTFVVVAALVLGLFILGWRAWVAPRDRKATSPHALGRG